MRSIKLPALTTVAAMLVFALLAPTADASAPPASTVTVDSTKPGCKRNPRRVALERQRTRSSADTAARGRGKKCRRNIYRTYRGTTSQGKRIELKTRTSEFGTKLFSGKVVLDFEAERMCTYSGGPVTAIPQEYSPFYQKLKAPERTFKVFDPAYQNVNQNLTMTGKVSTRMASGEATMAAENDDQRQCAAASFTFSIPKIRGGGGF